MEQICEIWDLNAFSGRLPTRLFHLTPQNIGRGNVEALSSYIANLALAHSNRVADLFTWEIFPAHQRQAKERFNRSFSYDNLSSIDVSVNGINATTEWVCAAVEYLTGRGGLNNHTLLPWRLVLSNQRLLHDSHVWCGQCYEEQKVQHKPVYDLLLWSLRDVRWCPWHHCRLRWQCPYCEHSFRRLTPRYQPGFCSYCRRWLGEGSRTLCQLPMDEDDFGRYSARTVSELLSIEPARLSTLTPTARVNGLRACLDRFADNNITQLARITNMDHSVLRRLYKENKLPTLRSMLRIGFCLGISLKPLLLDGLVYPETEPRFASVGSRIPSPRRKVDATSLRKSLEAILEQTPPVPLKQAAKQVNQVCMTLYRRYPDLCQHIVDRYAAYRHQQKEFELEALRYGLAEVLRCDSEPVLSMKQIARHSTFVYSKLVDEFPDLCKAISLRFSKFLHLQKEKHLHALCQQVEDATRKLAQEGIYPSIPKIRELIGIKGWNRTPEAHALWKSLLCEVEHH